MWTSFVIAGGLLVAAVVLVVPVLIVAGRTDRGEEARDEAWIEQLQAIAAHQANPVLAAVAERLPFEEEADAPQRAREWGRREYDQIAAKFPWAREARS